jgi:hypothetical protein
MPELAVWSGESGKWLDRPADEITWLDRNLLSGGEDRSLHRSPRCPALRYVHHHWELFSRDTTHAVYVAPYVAGTTPDHQAVEAAARYVLPVAQAVLEARPARLDAGVWLISVGDWVLPVNIYVALDERDQTTVPQSEGLATTPGPGRENGSPAPARTAVSDAVPQVTRYFQRNPTACMAMAYYYRDFIRGGLAPLAVPMAEVAVALDLSGEGAVSEYKKELQRRIWNETGHQRELGEFLFSNGLIGQADLERAIKVAAANEACGRTQQARERLRYSSKKLRHRELSPAGRGQRPGPRL